MIFVTRKHLGVFITTVGDLLLAWPADLALGAPKLWVRVHDCGRNDDPALGSKVIFDF